MWNYSHIISHWPLDRAFKQLTPHFQVQRQSQAVYKLVNQLPHPVYSHCHWPLPNQCRSPFIYQSLQGQLILHPQHRHRQLLSTSWTVFQMLQLPTVRWASSQRPSRQLPTHVLPCQQYPPHHHLATWQLPHPSPITGPHPLLPTQACSSKLPTNPPLQKSGPCRRVLRKQYQGWLQTVLLGSFLLGVVQ